MKRSKWIVGMAVLGCLALVLTGCETVPKGAALGGVLGAGTGAIIGHQSGHAGEGAVIGALAGAAAGAIASDIKARRQKTAQETAQTYNYQPAQGEVLELEQVQALPSQVKRGSMCEASIQYALLGTGTAGTTVKESRMLKQNGEVVAELGTKSQVRDDGTWVSAVQFKVLDNLQLGPCTVVQVIETSKSRVMGTANITIVE